MSQADKKRKNYDVSISRRDDKILELKVNLMEKEKRIEELEETVKKLQDKLVGIIASMV
jgi:predicted RNase H-like nuclease (RuvC/YqgF family)